MVQLHLPLILCAILLSSCATAQLDTHDPDVRQRTDLEQCSLSAAFARLGTNTIYDQILPASDLGGEFYTPINNRFPPNDPASRRILVREVRWTRGNRMIAAFSTRRRGVWFVSDAVEWHKDVRF